MISLRPPKTKYKSFDDIGKFNMIWNVCVVLVPIFFALFSIHVYFGNLTWATSLMACVIASLDLLILYRTRKYKIVGIGSVIIGVCMCQMLIFFVDDSQIISDVMWSVLISFFTFFMIGSFFGTMVLLTNLTGMVVFYSYADPEVAIVSPIDYKMIVDVFYVALALAFVVYKMMDNNKEINKRYEKEIVRNEILLKEIHHRVKNNLQIISSLLKLQAVESNDARLEDHFNEAINRIQSMALIHEKMYHNDDLTKIDIQSYLISLADDITRSFNLKNEVRFNVHSQVHQIDVKSIVPISLIFNELITNTLKHGLSDNKKGEINVEIKSNKDVIQFKYSDNGVWKDPSVTGTFGLELINTLTQQLDGTCEREVKEGTHYKFEFNSKLFFFHE